MREGGIVHFVHRRPTNEDGLKVGCKMWGYWGIQLTEQDPTERKDAIVVSQYDTSSLVPGI